MPTRTLWRGIALYDNDLDPHEERLWQAGQKAYRIVEIGTNRGNSTRIFATATEGQVWSIDKRECSGWTEQHPVPNVTFLVCNSLHVSWDIEVDLLFVDGEHSDTQVKQELDLYGAWVRQGGTILLHDTDHPTAGEAVRKALQNWCKGHLLSYTYHPGRYGLGEIPMTKDLSSYRA